jgi:hypothetical protein
MKPGTLIATIFLAFIALAHLARVTLGVGLTVGGRVIPVWASVPAFLFTGALAIVLWREHRR